MRPRIYGFKFKKFTQYFPPTGIVMPNGHDKWCASNTIGAPGAALCRCLES